MKKSQGGNTVKPGLYWNQGTWEIVPVSDRPGRLPGDADQRFVRVPSPLMLLLAPALGGALVMFMPFIGFAMVGQLLLRKAGVLSPARTAPQAASSRS
jgi:hypothetical protein